MPYFKLHGKPILPNNADCPVEVIKNSWGSGAAASAPFFMKNHYDPSDFEVTGNNMTLKCTGLVYTLIPTGSGSDPYAEAPHYMTLTANQQYKMVVHSHYADNNSFAPVQIYWRISDGSYVEENSIQFAKQNQSNIFTVLTSGNYKLRFDADLNVYSGRTVIIDSLIICPVDQRVELTGVTNKGYQLVTPTIDTDIIKPAHKDVFEGKLKINGKVQKYCRKGVAPLGTLLTEQGAGTYYIRRYEDGSVYLLNSNYNSIYTLSTKEHARKIFTIVLQAGGGGGAGANGWNLFFGGYNGGGGGGGGCSVSTITLESFVGDLRIVIGGGGSAGAIDKNGGSGGDSIVYGPNDIVIAKAEGGGAGWYGKNGHTAAGGAWIAGIYTSFNINTTGKYGGVGGVNGEDNNCTTGNDVPSWSTHIVGVQGVKLSFGNHKAGNRYTSGCGGSGGASAFGDGGAAPNYNEGDGRSGGTGAGGGGGDSMNTGGRSGGRGGDGRLQIYY